MVIVYLGSFKTVNKLWRNGKVEQMKLLARKGSLAENKASHSAYFQMLVILLSLALVANGYSFHKVGEVNEYLFT